MSSLLSHNPESRFATVVMPSSLWSIGDHKMTPASEKTIKFYKNKSWRLAWLDVKYFEVVSTSQWRRRTEINENSFFLEYLKNNFTAIDNFLQNNIDSKEKLNYIITQVQPGNPNSIAYVFCYLYFYAKLLMQFNNVTIAVKIIWCFNSIMLS